VLLASSLAKSPGGQLIHRERDFFGTIRVLYDAEANVHRLFHGNTLHGQQSLDPKNREEPSTYFTRSGPIGQLFAALEPMLTRSGSQVAIVGLGAGTLACYARPGQLWSFYEIDAAVIRIAQDPRYFTYLSDGQARGASIGIELGDARLRLREAPANGYQLIVLDAFSSDAVPVHLLSREAIQLYRSKLAEGGVLAFNVTNRYLDLEPVMGQQAADAGMACRVCYDAYPTAEERRAGKQGSIWAIMAGHESDLGHLGTDPRWQAPRIRPGAWVWTDDYSDLASYLVLGARKFPDPIAAPVETERATPGHPPS
jgi:spermidine synthase